MSYIERRQREKDLVKQKILEATIKIASKEGWQALTIRKIADEIEYTPPIVYEHFENKEDLIKELIYSGFSQLKNEFDQARENKINDKEFLRKLSLIHWDFAFSNIALYQLMFSFERPVPSEEMIYNLNLIKSTFLELANNDVVIAEEIGTYWACLTQGAISMMMLLPPPPHHKNKNPRELFIKIVDRFINSL